MKPNLNARFDIRNEAGSGPLEVLVYETIGKDPWTGDGMDCKAFLDKLSAADNSRELLIRFNSRGGDVFEGLAIHNRIKEWKGKTTGRVDGVAASIASVILMACREIEMPPASQLFIHDAWGICIGNASEMIDAARRLETSSDQLAEIYAARTKQPKSTCRNWMKESKLMTGREAKDLGFADALIDGEPSYNFSADDLTAIRSLLPGTNGDPKPNATATQPVTEPGSQFPAHQDRGESQHITPPKETPMPDETKAPVVDQNLGEISELKAEITKIKAERDAAKRHNVERTVDTCIAEDRIPRAQRDQWVTRAMADASVLELIANLPAKPPGAEPVGAVVVEQNASVESIQSAINKLDEPMKAWQRGNAVQGRDISAASFRKGQILAKERSRLIEMWNTNTVPAQLQRNVILSTMIEDFARKTLVLRQMTTQFLNVPLEGTNKVSVPYYDLDSSSSVSFVTANGYNTIGNTTTSYREIQVGNNGGNGALLCDRKYIGLGFYSEELARQPYLKIAELASLKVAKLAADVVAHVLGVVTNANYGAAAVSKAAALFAANDVADVVTACKLWPDAGRTLVLDTAYHAALLKDTTIKTAMSFGGTEAVRSGKIPTLFGFDYLESPTIPDNGENLTGFAMFKSAILFASAPVPPAAEVRASGTTYEIVTDPVSGVSLEYRTFGANATDTATHLIECNYGFAKGNGGALKRITSA